MDIQTKNLQKDTPLNLSALKRLIKKILSYKKISKANLSFVFVDNKKIIALNRRYLKRSYATDVLSFDLRQDKKDFLKGEIIISIEKAKENASRFKQSFKTEVVLYVIHGILHLIGYDDHSSKDITKMRKEEARILKYLGFKSA